MATILSTTELRSMQEKDLQGEIMHQKAVVAKLKMGIQLQKEKDSAKYQREKKTLARMETVLSEKRRGERGGDPPSPLGYGRAGDEKKEKPKALRGKTKSPKISAL